MQACQPLKVNKAQSNVPRLPQEEPSPGPEAKTL